jgi:hypothetical protein
MPLSLAPVWESRRTLMIMADANCFVVEGEASVCFGLPDRTKKGTEDIHS